LFIRGLEISPKIEIFLKQRKFFLEIYPIDFIQFISEVR